jgi:hypothetical protein
MKQEITNKMLSEKQVEEQYGFRVRTLQRWRTTGGGPRFYKVNRSVQLKT